VEWVVLGGVGLCGAKGGARGLPSSVMMGMLAPVVTEAWRTRPCTGLLSGDNRSIPGGVKPGEERGERREERGARPQREHRGNR